MNVAYQLRRLAKNPVKTVRYPIQVGLFSRRHPEMGDLVRRVRHERLTYLRPESLADLADAMMAVERQGLPGHVIEAGTALGGSAIVLAKAKNPGRPMKVYDAFAMIPAPSDHDARDVHRRYAEIVGGQATGIGGDVYYGYREDLLADVIANFRHLGVEPEANNVEFIKGYYEQTLRLDFPVALAHIDCDWYESVMTCLREIEPRVTIGGRLIIDDYYQWSGCTRAVDEYFADRQGYTFVHKSRLHIVKRG